MAYIPREDAISVAEPEARSAQRQMNPTEIEFAVRDLVAKPYDPATFPFDLIAIYNASPVTVKRLKSGDTNKAKEPGDVLWQKHVFFRPALPGGDVGAIGDAMAADPLTTKQKPRFIVVTNGELLHLRDLKLNDTENIEFERLDEQAYFLLPLAGYERRAVVDEHPADVKAAKKLKKLYDALLAANPTWNTGHHSHELNLLMTRLLFCFYAEKTGIFATPKVFMTTIGMTAEDGSDLAPLLDRLFRVMNVEEAKRHDDLTAAERRFPYVNGSLFEDTVEIPQFSRTARRQLLECGDLDWRTINPDIFGSMIQTIAHDGSRGDLGMHYTSVPNIMKALQPLFLDSLHDAFEKAQHNLPKLEALLGRLSRMRVFDPACGSGNFLVISYKELRKLEIEVIRRINGLSPSMPLQLSTISVSSFFGIDIVDFACETAKLSLWIAEHQMNSVFHDAFGSSRPLLPLAKIETIHCGNATRLDWQAICPPDDTTETYICGNPPYQGSVGQTPEQKAELGAILSSIMDGYTMVDYVACWFIKMCDYIAAARLTSGALVTTNSICQGEQVAYLWPYVYSLHLCIRFAHTSFKWSNNASHNAGVTCIIVGIGDDTKEPRRLYSDEHYASVPNINAYLVASEYNIVVHKQPEPLNGLTPAVKGNIPQDGGNLLLTSRERGAILAAYPHAAPLIRRFWGSKEFLHNLERYALWITDETLPFALTIPPISERIEKTRAMRLGGGSQSQSLARFSHRFGFIRHRDVESLIIPEASSERRVYIPVGILSANEIASNLLYVVYGPESYLLALLSSRLHRIWAATVGGRLKSDLRYSNNVVYNTFPVSTLSDEQKRSLADHTRNIIRTRAKHIGVALGDLYNPETMPPDLLAAHQENDEFLEKSIYGRAFADDGQRLERLFAMYAREREYEARDDSLFAAEVVA